MTEKLREWTVEIPLAGSASIVVEAHSEKEAIEKAWYTFNEEGVDEMHVEYELIPRICQGNVCYAPCWEENAKPGCELE